MPAVTPSACAVPSVACLQCQQNPESLTPLSCFPPYSCLDPACLMCMQIHFIGRQHSFRDVAKSILYTSLLRGCPFSLLGLRTGDRLLSDPPQIVLWLVLISLQQNLTPPSPASSPLLGLTRGLAGVCTVLKEGVCLQGYRPVGRGWPSSGRWKWRAVGCTPHSQTAHTH